MKRSVFRAALLPVCCAALLLTATGCNGCGGVATHSIQCRTGDCCKTNADCVAYETTKGNPDPSNYFCLVATETCEPIKKTCTNSGQCCPGQTCNTEIGLCTDTYTQCTDNTGCDTQAGQYCDMTLGIFPEGMGCTFQTCSTMSGNSGCAAGMTCFNGYCLDQPPCMGGCAAGSVCTPVNNLCFPLNSPSASCSQTCAPGNILVFQDGANVFNECNMAEDVNCACEALPPLQFNNDALWSDSALSGTEILVSAYDWDFGDLVLHHIDRTTLMETSLEWIDGVPATGMVTGDPAGPRSGISNPGPNVGEYTSVVYDASTDTTHVAYYGVNDPTQTPPTPFNDLRYAWRTGTGAWTIVIVDGGDAPQAGGDVGKYTSITLSHDSPPMPIISYFQEAGPGATNSMTALMTGVKVARAKVSTPMSATDFVISAVETEAIAPTPCSACNATETCVKDATNAAGDCVLNVGAGQCTTPDGGPSCATTDICGTLQSSGAVDAGTTTPTPTCYTPLTASNLAGLPPGDGLFTAIAYMDTVPVVVWYDGLAGQLKGNIATSDSPAQGANFSSGNIKVLDDGTGYGTTLAHDVGRYASIDIGPSTAAHRIAVAYVDETSRVLDLITADNDWANVTPASQRTVDNGVQASSAADKILFVGSDASVKFVNGLISIVYQDQTGVTLRYAQQLATAPADGGQSVAFNSTLANMGAGGFYARIATDGTTAFATHATIGTVANGQTISSTNTLAAIPIP